MFSYHLLKQEISLTEQQVECPVVDCHQWVIRQRNIFRKYKEYKCPVHDIYISPTTFAYSNESENLLWKTHTDFELLAQIKRGKREHRFEHDNSEDAVTWNTFRYLEKTKILTKFLADVSRTNQEGVDLVYWSYSQTENNPDNSWSWLNKARKEFGENLKRSSEPDLIAFTGKTLFFIETKLTASNTTRPSDLSKIQNYLKGGNHWHEQILKSDFEAVAVREKKYELLRFWLLGSWLAKEMGLDFYLLNVVRAKKEQDIEERFKRFIVEDKHRQFKRVSWEEIYGFISVNAPESREKNMVMTYFQNKTVGYDHLGKLNKAFSID